MMNKLNKALNIILIVIVSLVIVGLCVDFVFLNYRPEDTKAFNDVLIQYINKPLPVIGVSLVIVGKLILTLFTRTSLGKAQINSVKENLEETKEKITDEIKLLNDQKSALKSELDTLKQEISVYENEITQILELIPNKKVQDKLRQLTQGNVEEIDNEKREEAVNN